MEFWEILVLLFILLGFYLYNKKLEQNHEIKVIKALQKGKAEKTIAISKYTKETVKKSKNKFLKFVKKLLTFLF